MNRHLAGFLILALTLPNVLCQEQLPTSEKKVHKSEEDNKLYINKDLGIYLWLSTSPDPNAKKIRLLSDSSKKYSNPMYFDTEGYNTVRSPSIVDTNTKQPVYPQQDIIFEIYADGLSPVSKLNFESTKSKLIAKNWYYSSDLRIEITAKDAVSGIESINYSLNDKPFQIYKEKISGFNEGKNVIKYFGTDKVGNQEETKEKVFYIDKTPPITEFIIDGLGNGKYVSSKTKIQFSSQDSLSGLKAIYYRINEGKLTRYYKPIPVSVLGTDEGIISFYSEDNLGNKEKERLIGGKGTAIPIESGSASQNVTFEFYVDNDPPEIELHVEGDTYEGKYNFISPRSKIIINASDEKAGVEKILYSINSKMIDIQYDKPFSIEKEGMKYLRVKAVDYVKNVSPVQVHSFFCDRNAPQVKLTVGAPKYSSRDTLFVSDKTKFSISAIDNQSGVKAINYSLNNKDDIDYQSSFVVQKAGLQSISFFATDHVNNKNEIKNQEVFVDNVPPVIHTHFSVESIGNKTVRGKIYTIYPTNTMLYVAATDASSGGEKIEYRINDRAVLTANPIKNLAPGNYHVEVKAFDVLGNQSVENIKFAIE
jgi:hypothetical protein